MKKMCLAARIYDAYKPFRKKLFLHGLACIGIAIIEACKPYFLSIVIARLSKEPSIEAVIHPILWLAGAHALQTLVMWCRLYLETVCLDMCPAIELSLRNLRKILTLAICQHRSQHSGITQKVITQGKAAIDQIVKTVLYTATPLALQVAFNIVMVFTASMKIGWMLLASVIVFLIWTYLVNSRFIKRFIEIDKEDQRVEKLYTEMIRNLGLIQTFGEEARMYDEYEKAAAKYVQKNVSVWMRYESAVIGRHILTSVIECLIIYVGVKEMQNGSLSLGSFAAIATWSAIAVSNLWQAGLIYRQYIYQSHYAKKYFAIDDIEPLVKPAENPLVPAIMKGEISFDNVTYRYEECKYIPHDEDDEENEEEDGEELDETGMLIEKRQLALANVSFTIPAGQIVALVGGSGAGKSSLISLILRAADPSSGRIKIDGNDLRDLHISKYRQRVGVVEQDTKLISESIGYNMTFGRNGASATVSETELDTLAVESDIVSFRSRLKKGYKTLVGENGTQLSGGQRQRVAIARALGKDPAILIFDEATSSLDTISEKRIKEAIDRAAKGRTVLIIAHRLSTVRHADRVLVMKEGQIVGDGTHESLLETCDYYRELVKNQL